MKPLSTFLLSLLCFTARAQTRALDDYYKKGTSWCEYVWERASHNPSPAEWVRYSIGKDSTINSKTYHLLLQENRDVVGGIRTDAEKVYYLNITAANEILMYDFNLQSGDVLSWKPETNMVTAIDQVQLSDGSNAERYKLSGNGQTEFWIKGIGSNFGLLSSYISIHNPAYGFIYSAEFYYNPAPFSYSFYGQFSNQCFPTGTADITATTDQPAIYPNPASDQLSVRFPSNNYSLEIINTMGTIVYYNTFSTLSSTIDISSLPNGTYTMIILDKNNRHIEKLIILH